MTHLGLLRVYRRTLQGIEDVFIVEGVEVVICHIVYLLLDELDVIVLERRLVVPDEPQGHGPEVDRLPLAHLPVWDHAVGQRRLQLVGTELLDPINEL